MLRPSSFSRSVRASSYGCMGCRERYDSTARARRLRTRRGGIGTEYSESTSQSQLLRLAGRAPVRGAPADRRSLERRAVARARPAAAARLDEAAGVHAAF